MDGYEDHPLGMTNACNHGVAAIDAAIANDADRNSFAFHCYAVGVRVMPEIGDVLKFVYSRWDLGECSIRHYLVELAKQCWIEEEGFGGKRPFGKIGTKLELGIVGKSRQGATAVAIVQ